MVFHIRELSWIAFFPLPLSQEPLLDTMSTSSAFAKITPFYFMYYLDSLLSPFLQQLLCQVSPLLHPVQLLLTGLLGPTPNASAPFPGASSAQMNRRKYGVGSSLVNLPTS